MASWYEFWAQRKRNGRSYLSYCKDMEYINGQRDILERVKPTPMRFRLGKYTP